MENSVVREKFICYEHDDCLVSYANTNTYGNLFAVLWHHVIIRVWSGETIGAREKYICFLKSKAS